MAAVWKLVSSDRIFRMRQGRNKYKERKEKREGKYLKVVKLSTGNLKIMIYISPCPLVKTLKQAGHGLKATKKL